VKAFRVKSFNIYRSFHALLRSLTKLKIRKYNILFEGMTYRREGGNSVIIFLVTKRKDGTISEEKFVHRRAFTTKLN
jgi:hypothetical protein